VSHVVIYISKMNKDLIEELEDLEDVRLYDKAKKNDTGERIPMDEVFKFIESQRKENR
jgi:hypothetical protein